MRFAEWAGLYVLSLLWAGSFLFVEQAVGQLPPMTIVLIRVGLAALVLGAALPLLGVAYPKGAAKWGTLLAMGLLNCAMPFTLFTIAQGEISAGMTAILNATTPIFTLLSLWAFHTGRLGPWRIFGAVAGFSGVAVMMGGAEGGTLKATLCCLGAAACYGLGAVLSLRVKRLGIAPQQAAFGQLSMAALILLPLVIVHDAPLSLPMPSRAAIVSLVALACASTAFAYLLFFRLMVTAGALSLSLVTLLIPINTLAISTLMTGDWPSVRQVLGMTIIFGGLALIDHARRRDARAA